MFQYLECLMVTEVWNRIPLKKQYSIGKEVALYVKDKYIEELKKLQSFKNRDYFNALKESFIRIDELLKSPQGLKDIKKYSGSDEN